MKKFINTLAALLVFCSIASGHGVAIKNAGTSVYFRLTSSNQVVTVYDQVATTVTTQVFKNLTGSPSVVKYAFPLHEEASATSLRWKVNGIWQTAIFAPAPQDTTFPGGGTPNLNLMTYLGTNPLLFEVPDTVAVDSTLVVEFSYVELLPYSFGTVHFSYPNDYHLIQTTGLAEQNFHFVLESQRVIDSISFTGISGATITNTGSHAEISYVVYEMPAVQDYGVSYSLALNTMGLYGYSTYLPDSLMVCDSLGNGFFTFIVEPQPDTTQVIQKVFSLVIDRSGSMMGDKMEQAKEAATFIVNHLNPGDYFNLIAFDDVVLSFRPDHVPCNTANKQAAISFINSLYANGMTDISGALHTTIEDYAGNDTTVANIVIFLTDGQPTAGIISTSGILQSIQNDLTFYEVQYLMINTFGIGMDVNQQLLSQIASQNNGLCQFLLNNELQELISQFYLMICNPVLLNTGITFDPPIVSEAYPDPLPYLYIGQQLILAGRYDTILTTPLHITLTGQAFGQVQAYDYYITLSDSMITDYLFTTKIWAIKKIDYLYIQYFTYPTGSAQADSIKDLIINISMCYNVSSPFTHFGSNPPVGIEEASIRVNTSQSVVAFPNPFLHSVAFTFETTEALTTPVKIVIFNSEGKLITTLWVECPSPGQYTVTWDGKDTGGNEVPEGLYIYTLAFPDKNIQGKLLKVNPGK
jgi:Ca-activated chloride channel family protein